MYCISEVDFKILIIIQKNICLIFLAKKKYLHNEGGLSGGHMLMADFLYSHRETSQHTFSSDACILLVNVSNLKYLLDHHQNMSKEDILVFSFDRFVVYIPECKQQLRIMK